MPQTVSPAAEKFSLREFVPVALETLLPASTFPFDLYMRTGQEQRCILFRHRATPCERADLERLLVAGIQTLYVRFTDHDAYNQHLFAQLNSGPNLAPAARYRLLHAATRAVLSDAFKGGTIDAAVFGSTGIAEQIVVSVCEQQNVLRQLYSLMAHDYYTYTHANNVSMYCVALAQALGISSREELAAIAIGGLLHDIGKRRMPSAILNKQGPLNEKEEAQIKRHPQFGFEELCLRHDLSRGQLMVVYQHHERLGGTGYPVQVDGDEIHPWAKICAVADVFDALTMNRSYRKPASLEEGLGYFSGRAAAGFDPEVVRCLQVILSTP